MSYIIDVKGVTFSIGNTTIIKDISFSVEESEYFSIIGPNGSGKTTLLKCINRIYKAGKGEIKINNIRSKMYKQRDIAKLIGYVPQASAQNYQFTVYEFVLMGRYPYLNPISPPGKEDRKAVFNALEITGTEDFITRPVDTLSGGEKQKVFIAAALAQGSKILLLDEPTTFLDPKHQEDIQNILVRINIESRVTIISVTHDINSVLCTSDKILALKEGRIFFLGSPEKLLQNKILDNLYDKAFVVLKHPATGMPVVL